MNEQKAADSITKVNRDERSNKQLQHACVSNYF